MASPEQPGGRHGPQPSRFELPSVFTWVVLVGFLAFFIQGITAVDVEGSRLIAGVGNMGDFIARAVPPDLM
ncbi:hypothetical protein [Aquisalimonas asiatica]|uniref:Phosphonate transport system permease protein n=1 Tax=Aquisalimonas asiatica TaxID=406100 RepID=A0A1H8RTF1_9GAMM|nr:hypothetical protein [Aquisalimonas asiatica]SEO69203.1 phosphonate transport system permease protein [Aquisalimonas asiatica]